MPAARGRYDPTGGVSRRGDTDAGNKPARATPESLGFSSGHATFAPKQKSTGSKREQAERPRPLSQKCLTIPRGIWRNLRPEFSAHIEQFQSLARINPASSDRLRPTPASPVRYFPCCWKGRELLRRQGSLKTGSGRVGVEHATSAGVLQSCRARRRPGRKDRRNRPASGQPLCWRAVGDKTHCMLICLRGRKPEGPGDVLYITRRLLPGDRGWS